MKTLGTLTIGMIMGAAALGTYNYFNPNKINKKIKQMEKMTSPYMKDVK